MGNNTSATTQTTEQRTGSDFPPKHPIHESPDKDLLIDVIHLHSQSSCARIQSKITELQSFGRLKSFQDETGSNWLQALHNTCVLSYLDRPFYQCLVSSKIQVPEEFEYEAEHLISKYKSFGEQITKNEMMNRKMGVAMSKCFTNGGNEAINELNRRMTALKLGPSQNEALREFVEMTSTSTTQVTKEDTSEQIAEKVDQVKGGPCKPYWQELSSIQPRSDNAMTVSRRQTYAGACLIANLCPAEIRRCTQEGNSMLNCNVDYNKACGSNRRNAQGSS